MHQYHIDPNTNTARCRCCDNLASRRAYMPTGTMWDICRTCASRIRTDWTGVKIATHESLRNALRTATPGSAATRRAEGIRYP